MNADRFIHEFEALAPAEKARLLAQFRRWMAGDNVARGETGVAPDAEFGAAAAWVLREHDELLRKHTA